MMYYYIKQNPLLSISKQGSCVLQTCILENKCLIPEKNIFLIQNLSEP